MKLKIFSRSLEELFKVRKQDFTRKRKLTFSLTLIFMMNLIRKSLSIEIDGFMRCMRSDGEGSFDSDAFTSSAYVQARKKIKAEVFIELSSVLIEEFYTDNELGVQRWNGFRLLAVDGSTMNLPATDELQQIYGQARNQTGDTTVQGRVSVLYDVLNRMALDAHLSPRCIAERELALRHLKKAQEKDLIIYDRGYYSYGLIKAHVEKKIDFLFRAKADLIIVKAFIASGKKTQVVQITPGKYIAKAERGSTDNTPIELRLIRVELPDGEIEVLATSLLDPEKYPSEQFKALYFERWKIETYYDELKNKLKTEHFTGYSDTAVQQDFHTAILISNIQSLIVSEINEEVREDTKNRKLKYKVNTNLSYGFLKDRILTLLFSKENMEGAMEEIKKIFKKHLVPIRPNRTVPRTSKTRRNTKKLEVTKNQRDAI